MKQVCSIFSVLLLMLGALPPVSAREAELERAGTVSLLLSQVISFAASEWDLQGGLNKIASDRGAGSVAGFGASLEYSLKDWLSMGVSWLPATILIANVNLQPPADRARFDCLYGITGTIKTQLLGDRGIWHLERLRGNLSLSLRFPPPQPDWEEQRKAFEEGEDFFIPQLYVETTQPFWGYGIELNCDYLVSERFYVNFHHGFSRMLPEKFDFSDFPDLLPSDWLKPKIDLGYRVETGIAPHLIFPLPAQARIHLEFPLALQVWGPKTFNGESQEDTWGSAINTSIYVSLESLASSLPFEAGLLYSTAAWGINTRMTHTFVVIIGTYFNRPPASLD